MKGISHFAIGIASASCFPLAVNAGSSGNPVYFIIAGIAGLIPDTIDFKFYRFFYHQDIRITPDPIHPDPQETADTLAEAMIHVAQTGRPLSVKLDTIRLGPDLWQSYSVTFDTVGGNVVVKYGSMVNTNGKPVSHVKNLAKSYKASLPCKIKLDYQATTTIDIFEGPVFRLTALTGNTVTPLFIPWHRRWSHSLVIGLLFSLMTAKAFGIQAGIVALTAYCAHILVDQLGFMGSNLFYPFTSDRAEGLKLVHSGDTIPNLSAVWISCLVVFWNLYCATPGQIMLLNPLKLTLFGLLLPTGIIQLLLRNRAS